MNAIRHEEREKFVLTNEAIEVHLSYLRTGLEAVQTELPKLREKIETLDEKLCGRIETSDEKLTGKIEALDEKLTGKIEALDEKLTAKIDALDNKLSGTIQALDQRLSSDIKSVDERLGSRIDHLDVKLSGKIDQANADRAVGDAALGEKIDTLTEVVLKMQGSQDGLKWFIASVAIIASGVTIARSLGWI